MRRKDKCEGQRQAAETRRNRIEKAHVRDERKQKKKKSQRITARGSKRQKPQGARKGQIRAPAAAEPDHDSRFRPTRRAHLGDGRVDDATGAVLLDQATGDLVGTLVLANLLSDDEDLMDADAKEQKPTGEPSRIRRMAVDPANQRRARTINATAPPWSRPFSLPLCENSSPPSTCSPISPHPPSPHLPRISQIGGSA